MKFTLFLVFVFAAFRLFAQEDRKKLNERNFQKYIVNSWHSEPLDDLGVVRKAVFTVKKLAEGNYSIAIVGEINDGSSFAFVSDCEITFENDFFILFIDRTVGEVPPAIYGYFNSKDEIIFAFSGQKKLEDLNLETLNWLRMVK